MIETARVEPQVLLLDTLLRENPSWPRERLRVALEEAERAAPGVRFEAQPLAARLRATPAEVLEGETLRDLLLAHACARGDRAAIGYLERTVLPSVRPALGRFGDGVVVDELLQLVRERLLLGTPPKLDSYAGVAPLSAWIRVVAVRTALNQRRGTAPELATEEEALERLVTSGVQLPKALDGARFEAAFRAALTSLSLPERSLLRLYFLDGFTVERIATMYGINKSTASRRIAAARAQLFTRLRKAMREELGIDLDEARSLVRWVRSQINLNLSQLLASGGGEISRNK